MLQCLKMGKNSGLIFHIGIAQNFGNYEYANTMIFTAGDFFYSISKTLLC